MDLKEDLLIQKAFLIEAKNYLLENLNIDKEESQSISNLLINLRINFFSFLE